MGTSRAFFEATVVEAISIAVDARCSPREREDAAAILRALAGRGAEVDVVGATLEALVKAVAEKDDRAKALSPLLEMLSAAVAEGRPALSLHDVLRATFVEHEEIAHAGLRPTIPTGLVSYDEPTGGLRGGELTIVRAEGDASTRMALRLAVGFVRHGKAAMSRTGPACFIAALTHSPRQLAEMLLGDDGGVSPNAIRRGVVSEKGWSRLAHAAPRVGGRQIWIDEHVDASNLRTRFVSAHDHHPELRLLVVDGVERFGPDACRVLLRLARDLNVPIIAAATRRDTPMDRDPDVFVEVTVDAAGRFKGSVRPRGAAAPRRFATRMG